MKTLSKWTFLFFAIVQSISAQSIDELKAAYSGKVSWESETKRLTFSSSGTIHFDKPDYKEHFWEIPQEVKEVFIEQSVTVQGAFHTFSDCRIHGADRKTSIVYGTFEREWANNRPIQEWYYCQFQNFGGALTIENLTCLNPFSYFIRGWDTPNYVKSCDFIDYRGGEHNHSDGFSGGDGSIVQDCYFESGDDVFKAYFDNTIRNCSIRMIKNTVPIQMGWGNYSDGAECTFENVVIFGDGGRRSSGNAIICGRKGKFQVGVTLDHCSVENPFASFISLWKDSMSLTGDVTNSKILVGRYWDKKEGESELTINGQLIQDPHIKTGTYPQFAYIDPVQLELSTQKDYFEQQLSKWNLQYPEVFETYSNIFKYIAEVDCLTLRIGKESSDPCRSDQKLWSLKAEDLITSDPKSDYPWMSISNYVSKMLERKRMDKQTPIDLIRSIHVRCDAVLDSIDEIHSTAKVEAYPQWQTHLKASAYLGKYWANKLEAAVFLRMLKTFPTHQEQHRGLSLQYLHEAERNWSYFEQTTQGNFTGFQDFPFISENKGSIRALVENEIETIENQ